MLFFKILINLIIGKHFWKWKGCLGSGKHIRACIWKHPNISRKTKFSGFSCLSNLRHKRVNFSPSWSYLCSCILDKNSWNGNPEKWLFVLVELYALLFCCTVLSVFVLLKCNISSVWQFWASKIAVVLHKINSSLCNIIFSLWIHHHCWLNLSYLKKGILFWVAKNIYRNEM